MTSENEQYLTPADLRMANEAFITGDLLRWARERCDLTYGDIARAMGVAVDKAREWESEESYPPFGKAQALAHFLRVPFGYLFLSKRPSDDAPIPDFRTVANHGPRVVQGDILMADKRQQPPKRITNSKPIPHIPLPFREVIADVLKVKPPEKQARPKRKKRSN